MNFGSTDDAFVRVIFGELKPQRKLPFDIPSSMAAVEASQSDVPFDTANPVFRFGHGLRYEDWVPTTAPEPIEAPGPVADGYNLNTTPLGTLLDDPKVKAMRTPRRAQISRKSVRNEMRTSTAYSSPSRSVRAVKPETSTKAKLRWTRTHRSCHVFD